MAAAVAAAAIALAILIDKLTGLDGFRALGYVVLALGLGLATWNSLPSRRGSDMYLKSTAIVLLGAFIAFQQ